MSQPFKKNGAASIFYKDQVRKAHQDAAEPNAVPVVAATPVLDAPMENERFEEMQQRILELEQQQLSTERRLEEIQQLEEAEEQPQQLEETEEQLQGSSQNRIPKKKPIIIIGGFVCVILVAVATVVGVCSSGSCGGPPETSLAASGTSPNIDTSPITVSSPATPLAPSTNAPQPTPAPITPSTAPVSSRVTVVLASINSITLSGRTLQYPSQASAEERALQWLIDEDVGTNETNALSLRQRYALATLWLASGGFLYDSGTWLSSTDECSWENIASCVEGEVASILLSSNGLEGQLPADIGLLTSLTRLDLLHNELTGTIPTTLGSLKALTMLDMRGNQLTGTIPTTLGQLTALKELHLWDNQLIGTIPSELSSLSALTELWLISNELTGTIPSQFTRLSLLRIFWVYNNNLSGSMPFCGGATGRFNFLAADCDEVDCPCCTHCCPLGGWNGIPQPSVACGA